MRIAARVLLFLLVALSAALLWRAPQSYATQNRAEPSAPATQTHPLGTDELGRDRLARSAAALLLGLFGSGAASAVATALSLAFGMAAALSPAPVGSFILYLGDLFLALPWIFLLMLLRSALPLNLSATRSAAVTFALLAALGIPAFLRFHYTRTRVFHRSAWMLQGKAAGLRPMQIARGMLPHLRPMVVAQFLLYLPACIVAEANLGSLGLGVSEPLSSWGSLLQSLQGAALNGNSSLVYAPLVLLVLVLVLLEGMARGEATDPAAAANTLQETT